MPLSCAECDRLWEELASATKAYAMRISEQQAKKPEPCSSDLAKLNQAIRDADEAQKASRRAILDHVATHSPPAG